MPDTDYEKIDKETKFRRNRIPDYRTDGADDLLFAWKEREERSIYPFDGGWATQPAHIIDSFQMFDYVYGIYNEQEKRRNENQRSARSMKGRGR